MIKYGLVIIGTEITRAYGVDTNSTWLTAALTERGYTAYAVTRVPDDISTISRTIAYLAEHCRFIILSGGLGPTHDDVTREALARYLGCELELRPELKARLEPSAPTGEAADYFFRQAYLPAGAEPIPPTSGTAPGVIIRHQGRLLFALPGVPRELRAMFPTVLRVLAAELPAAAPATKITIKTIGAHEPTISRLIAPVLRAYPKLNFTMLAGPEGVNITVSGTEAVKARRAADALSSALGRLVFAVGESSLAAVVGDLLRRRRLSLFVAESCTGGLLAGEITAVAGSSDYFLGGVTAYSNKIKREILGVPAAVLNKRGAVSRETAAAMADGARRLAGADIAAAVTGIAGPGGGGPEKPVGLVYAALSGAAGDKVEKFNFRGGRAVVRRRTVQATLNLIRLYLEADNE